MNSDIRFNKTMQQTFDSVMNGDVVGFTVGQVVSLSNGILADDRRVYPEVIVISVDPVIVASFDGSCLWTFSKNIANSFKIERTAPEFLMDICILGICEYFNC